MKFIRFVTVGGCANCISLDSIQRIEQGRDEMTEIHQSVFDSIFYVDMPFEAVVARIKAIIGAKENGIFELKPPQIKQEKNSFSLHCGKCAFLKFTSSGHYCELSKVKIAVENGVVTSPMECDGKDFVYAEDY